MKNLKKIVLSILLTSLLLLTACNSQSMEETTPMSLTSTSYSASTSENSQLQESATYSSENEEETFQELEQLVGVWTNKEEEQTFAITERGYISEEKEYVITGVDVNKEENDNKYVLSWDTDAFVKKYGEPETFNPQPFIYDYNSEEDTLSNFTTFQRETDDNQVYFIKDKLAGYEPVNLEQLLEVDESHLLAYWYKATAESDSLNKQLAIVYHEISIDYPDLELLTGKEYEKYQTIAKEIENSSEYSFSDLNPALPQNIYQWYIELTKNNNEKDTMKQLLPKIEEAREQYFERKEQNEQPYLNEPEETNDPSNEEIDKEMETHIREKIKEEFPEDMPKDHVIYDMELEENRVKIRVYENKNFNKQYQVGFIYDTKEDKLTKQST